MLSLKKGIESLDEFFGGVLWPIAGIIIEILLAASFVTSNLLLFSIPVVAFLVWTWVIVYGYRAKMRFRNRYEMRFLETARAYAYFFCLAFTMIANSLEVFYQSIIVTPIVVVTVGIGPNLILAILVRSIFSEQIALFEKEQKVQFNRILDYAARASIYYSMAVAIFDLIIFNFLKASYFPNAFVILALSAITLIPAYAIYDREQRSRKLEEVLAASLQKTKLKNKYETKLKIKLKREKKKKALLS
jgi:Zn-dependent protease with chaperone function